MISIDRVASSQSGTLTGNGSAQSVAHTLGVVPDLVLVQTDTVAATVTLGAHTASNVVVTVTNGVTYRWIAFANAQPAPN